MPIKIKRPRIAPFVYLLQKIFFRMTLFSFFVFTAMSILYAAGNYQKFLDSTQAFILQMLIYISITLLFFSGLSIFTSIVDTLLSKIISKRKIVATGFYFMCILLSATVMLASRTILALAAGTD